MITKLKIGERYNIIGVGKWEELDMDIVVLAATVYSQLDPQDIDLYKDWFEEYDIDEATFEQIMQDDPYIYHCRKLISRDPAIETNDGEEVYIFPGLINYQTSSKLLPAKIITYTLTMAPFREIDDLYPFKHVTDQVIKDTLNGQMLSMTYDSITTRQDDRDILVTMEEYNKLTEQRMKIKTSVSSLNDSESSNIAEERAHMYNVVNTVESKMEELRVYELSLDSREKEVQSKWNDVLSARATMNRKEAVIKNKYSRVKALIDEYNENVPVGDRITIPAYDDL